MLPESPARTVADRRRKDKADREKVRQLAEEADEEERTARRQAVCLQVLGILEETNTPFIDLLRYVSDPSLYRGKERYWGLFRDTAGVSEILDMWVSSGNSMTGRETVRKWATTYVAQLVAREGHTVCKDGFLRTEKRPIDEHFALDFSLEALASDLRGICPTMMDLLSAFSTSARQKRMATATWMQRHRNYLATSALICLSARSQKNNYARNIFALYAYTSGAKRQMIELLSHIGLCCSYNSLTANLGDDSLEPDDPNAPSPLNSTPATKKKRVEGILKRLSDACRRAARANASTRLLAFVYDNINMVFRIAEQIMGRKDTQENGTCATAFELYGAGEEAMQTADLMTSIVNAPPLKYSDLLFSPQESQDYNAILQRAVLRIIVAHGGEHFARFKANVEGYGPLLDTRIPLHRTNVYPVPSMKIDESTTVGNAEVTKAVLAELGKDMSSEDFGKVVQVIAGDQLSIARLRTLMKNRSGHDSFSNSFLWAVVMPGFFHYKMAGVHGFMELHYGHTTSHRNPGSLAFHNTVLDRKPITLTSLPPFRTCQDLIFVSLYARVLICLEAVSSCASLEDYSKHVSWTQLQAHVAEIVDRYTSSRTVSRLRTARAAEIQEQSHDLAQVSAEPPPRENDRLQGDMVYENALLFMRDALVLRALTDAIKAGVSGHVVLLLKALGMIYRGSGRTKYAQEVLFLCHNLTHVWPEGLRYIVLENWLINPTGKPDSWVEVDLFQEHMNFWIKTIYRAHGVNASWEWLAMISPCIDILRRLSTQMNTSLGAKIGSKHTNPSIEKDITLLMDSLRHHRVYELHPGRTIDDDNPVVPDALTVGLELLEGPLGVFNEEFSKLQARCQSTPLTGGKYPGLGTHSSTASSATPQSSEPQSQPSTGVASDVHIEAPVQLSDIVAEQHSDVNSDAEFDPEGEEDSDGEDEDYDEGQNMFSLDMPGDVALDPDRLDNFEFGI
ncbi:uncharacterized protein B0H18DRAFT_887406 [Fomitopsis serialis]|uniref:uncharacterized protein n=1 Tax=Fomitopsis serialis TaxID=139415 RepID=UPI00200867F0|nr:uncharacterized protein B0H18DRAFT_887406 [Neoantrodia serialis]KAH9914215.1 hypothetical protein B0H18DRAFT_887406 [Neoantrodia serialis]